jgi:hypothetical protein
VSYLSQQRATTSVRAIAMPACECGHAQAAHTCGGWHPIGKEPCACRSYRPARTPAYRLSVNVGRLRRLTCGALWQIEWYARLWRERFEQTR